MKSCQLSVVSCPLHVTITQAAKDGLEQLTTDNGQRTVFNMPYELFLALRYLQRSKRRGRRRRAGARVTALAGVIGISCGVGALIFALALSNGFQDEMRDKILGGTAHITLMPADGKLMEDANALTTRLRGVA